MSHFIVMVIGDDPELQLAPFDENESVDEYCVGEVSSEQKELMMESYEGKDFDACYKANGEDWNGNRWRKENGVWYEYSTYNPNSKWDWYQLGGRWSGRHIRLKENATSGVKGSPGIGNNIPGWDAALKGDIDFDALHSEVSKEARATYREIAEKCGGSIPRLEISWAEIIDENGKYSSLSIKEMRSIYHSQKAVQIWTEATKGYWLNIDDFQCSEDEYVQHMIDGAFVPYAVVKDGEWLEKGQMGWWGISSNEQPECDWNKTVNEIVASLPNDTLISFYDCHI